MSAVLLSPRPQVVTDPAGGFVGGVDPVMLPSRGMPFGNERMVTALPTNKSAPVCLEAATAVVDQLGVRLADPDGAIVGTAGLWCHRCVTAGKTIDTRRL